MVQLNELTVFSVDQAELSLSNALSLFFEVVRLREALDRLSRHVRWLGRDSASELRVLFYSSLDEPGQVDLPSDEELKAYTSLDRDQAYSARDRRLRQFLPACRAVLEVVTQSLHSWERLRRAAQPSSRGAFGSGRESVHRTALAVEGLGGLAEHVAREGPFWTRKAMAHALSGISHMATVTATACRSIVNMGCSAGRVKGQAC